MKNVAILISLSMLSSCNYFFGRGIDWSSREKMDAFAARYFMPFYQGNPNPPKILESDYKGYVEALNNPKYNDLKTKLTKQFGTQYYLWAYYFMDMDGDGISDWRWDNETKKFSAVDQDIDNDGVANYEDADPYDNLITNSDSDFDGIVDHLDWDKNNDGLSDSPLATDQMAVLQRNLYKQFTAIAINQDATHNLRTLKTFGEVLELGFSKVIKENNGHFPGLRYLGAQRGEDGGNTLAWYNRKKKMITILDLGREEGENKLFPGITPLPFYATVIHELAHTLHHHIYNRDSELSILKEELNRYWLEQNDVYIFRGDNKSDWKTKMDEEVDKRIADYKRTHDPEDLPFYDFSNKRLIMALTDTAKDNEIISTYSLTSDFEYFAEATAAYALKVVVQKRFSHKSGKVKEKLTKQLERNVIFESGLGINNIPKSLEEIIEDELHLAKDLYFDRDYTHASGLRGKWSRY